MELTQDYIRHLLDYRDGQLFWKHPKQGRQLNRPVGCPSNGYLLAMIEGKLLKVHRLVFMWHHGHMPKLIDHINLNRSDNRIENLREATDTQSLGNRSVNRNNTSGFKGVTWEERRQKWVAQIMIDFKHIYLGQFDDPAVAHRAYMVAAANHFGEFARSS